MASGNAIIAMDTPENREVTGDAGMYFSKSVRVGERDYATACGPISSLRIRPPRKGASSQALRLERITDQYVELARVLRTRK